MVARYLYKKIFVMGRLKYIKKPSEDWEAPSRKAMMERLESETFDLVIVGGGSTGAGCALDGATRGLKVALVEALDFGSGTSSKSTKLVHGGVRYLASAVSNLDWSQYRLVWQALDERSTMFKISPYLTNSIKILVPIYSRILIPYYYLGLKLYDWISGLKSLGKSYFIGRKEAIDVFPHVNKKNLCGAMVYFDGQQDDVRNNVMLVMTAVYHGAVAVNYLSVNSLVTEEGKITGVRCRDSITGFEIEIKSAGVINSTGNFADGLRKMNDGNAKEIMIQSSGTHIVIPKEYAPKEMGFLDPLTGDNRIAFFMPWMGKTLVGSTDVKSKNEASPSPTKEDLEFLVHEVRAYTSQNPNLKKDEVSAIWTGIRPLVKDVEVSETSSIVRKHFVQAEKNGLLTVTGGKWTIYRKIAEDAIDLAVSTFSLKPKGPCVTKYVQILGANGYGEDTWISVQKKLNVPKDVAKRLVRFYGTNALKLSKYIKKDRKKLLSVKYSYFSEEVEYCIDNEMAVRICDVLCNRLMIGLMDVKEAYGCIEKVLETFKRKHGWDADRCNREEVDAIRMLNTYGLKILREDLQDDSSLQIECPGGKKHKNNLNTSTAK
ncbi:glycerol-3-phosphate dehydrogenase [Encephalitozoon romaleae SJ-2008]|uniref:Glycerol-3-phosphate dehydrogenase n=1 Tax=Encephalitozoon romaleae (strain SJ-2008) TaxID=1178016 RepID=I6ZVV9_ENCRO|nr:glycerol-3-phosphate dehydrogenase [Encephalitozoon romaleae SJ-2008]AFN83891.1 glycerol-3-phosphate dehydrogenase [Encephalitozoon romaleae SJ-2008]